MLQIFSSIWKLVLHRRFHDFIFISLLSFVYGNWSMLFNVNIPVWELAALTSSCGGRDVMCRCCQLICATMNLLHKRIVSHTKFITCISVRWMVVQYWEYIAFIILFFIRATTLFKLNNLLLLCKCVAKPWKWKKLVRCSGFEIGRICASNNWRNVNELLRDSNWQRSRSILVIVK